MQPPSTSRPQLSLILPCYNEAEHIEQSIPEIVRVLDAARWSYEIVFVDDASQDNTRDLIRRLIVQFPDRQLSAIYHEMNTGRGGAVRDGFLSARGEIVGYIDIDLEVRPLYIPSCMLALEDGADVCIGLRIYRLQLHNFLRHVLSRGYALMVRRLLNLPYLDTESGYKFMRRPAALELLKHTQDQGWFWDTEVMYFAHNLGYRVVELPCLFMRRKDKTSTVRPIRDSLAYWRSLSRFRRYVRTHRVTSPASPAAQPSVRD